MIMKNFNMRREGLEMIVLCDLEWIEKDEVLLTKRSALRVSQDWDVQSKMDTVISSEASRWTSC